ncbi:pentatricopeptide repeat-containing protein, putative [Ricinus communis]|uniref:Pentatricopeptide repeat-containing protein, putative n=1 Tax=Ricinus communis TaxID=3988 RepID=B9T804_RICCO|nr:pentatricopeptide repeat-containing protein, putative [Ricinus communis]
MSANALCAIGSIITIHPHFPKNNYHSLALNCLLNSCSSLSHLKLTHALTITTGFHNSLLLSTKLITSASALSSSMDYARKLFDKMPQRDVFLWNTLIRGYADLGPYQEAVMLYKTMHHDGFLPDNYTFPFVVRSCAVISALKEGKEVYCNVIKNGFDLDVFAQCFSLYVCSRWGDFEKGDCFGEVVVRNIVSWTAVTAGYVQNGLFK